MFTHYDERWAEYREEQITAEQIGKPEVRTARVERTCHQCPQRILPGQRYARQCWIVDGEIWIETVHADWQDCAPYADG